MGWSDCGFDKRGRPIGYSHSATCDYSGCKAKIDRGLAYVCGGMHGEDELSCDRYFCSKHRQNWIPDGDRIVEVCKECEEIWRRENPVKAAEFDEE